MPVKNKLSKLSQAHGKVESFEPTTLEQVWGGANPTAIYGTMDESVYRRQLDEMDKADLQTHATQKGEIPIDNMPLLKRKLVRRFHDTLLPYIKPITPPRQAVKISAEVEKILAEGR